MPLSPYHIHPFPPGILTHPTFLTRPEFEGLRDAHTRYRGLPDGHLQLFEGVLARLAYALGGLNRLSDAEVLFLCLLHTTRLAAERERIADEFEFGDGADDGSDGVDDAESGGSGESQGSPPATASSSSSSSSSGSVSLRASVHPPAQALVALKWHSAQRQREHRKREEARLQEAYRHHALMHAKMEAQYGSHYAADSMLDAAVEEERQKQLMVERRVWTESVEAARERSLDRSCKRTLEEYEQEKEKEEQRHQRQREGEAAQEREEHLQEKPSAENRASTEHAVKQREREHDPEAAAGREFAVRLLQPGGWRRSSQHQAEAMAADQQLNWYVHALAKGKAEEQAYAQAHAAQAEGVTEQAQTQELPRAPPVSTQEQVPQGLPAAMDVDDNNDDDDSNCGNGTDATPAPRPVGAGVLGPGQGTLAVLPAPHAVSMGRYLDGTVAVRQRATEVANRRAMDVDEDEEHHDAGPLGVDFGNIQPHLSDDYFVHHADAEPEHEYEHLSLMASSDAEEQEDAHGDRHNVPEGGD